MTSWNARISHNIKTTYLISLSCNLVTGNRGFKKMPINKNRPFTYSCKHEDWWSSSPRNVTKSSRCPLGLNMPPKNYSPWNPVKILGFISSETMFARVYRSKKIQMNQRTQDILWHSDWTTDICPLFQYSGWSEHMACLPFAFSVPLPFKGCM